MDTKKSKKINKKKKLIIYEDKETGTIFLRPCGWSDGKYKLKHHSLGMTFTQFKAFNTELGKQVKNYLNRCD